MVSMLSGVSYLVFHSALQISKSKLEGPWESSLFKDLLLLSETQRDKD